MAKKKKQEVEDVAKKMQQLKFKTDNSPEEILKSLQAMEKSEGEEEEPTEDIKQTRTHLNPEKKRFHGMKLSSLWLPNAMRRPVAADRFGYITPTALRTKESFPFNAKNRKLMNELGRLMADSQRDDNINDSNIPAGYTYLAQFIDHDITLDIDSSIGKARSAGAIFNRRTPALDLDNVYGGGPALTPYLFEFPSSGNRTAIKFVLGNNRNTGTGGPGGTLGARGMQIQTDFDLPRMSKTSTAIIGDPRNDENLIISQLHHALLKFHNQVVDLFVLSKVEGDIFVKAKGAVTLHYQWMVVHDFLKRICGASAVNTALKNVQVEIDSSFRMPVEFSVAAFRFGHSMIRNDYWVNFNFPKATLNQLFQFVRKPNLPVFSNWAVDFNAFAPTGVPVPIFNNARKIDSVLSKGLEQLPDFTGIMKVLATRNLRRSLALGLPSGQALAAHLGVPKLKAKDLIVGLTDRTEIDFLRDNNFHTKTPLWYYILREAAVKGNGNRLGPLGAKIVADTFITMLKRDKFSILNRKDKNGVAGNWRPTFPAAKQGDFTLADLLKLSGVTTP